MALYINDIHILYSHIYAFKLTMLGHSYPICPDYSVVKEQIRAMLPSTFNNILAGPNVQQYIKFFPGLVRYFHFGLYADPCHHIVAIVGVTIFVVVRLFPHCIDGYIMMRSLVKYSVSHRILQIFLNQNWCPYMILCFSVVHILQRIFHNI